MYIKDVCAISPQLTYSGEFETGDFQLYEKEMIVAVEPSYLDFIPASLLRRMGKAVRMGIGAGLPLIKQNPAIDGVIIGTANGGLEDCIRFLNQIVDYEEGVLTPTNFVQSTPNSVAGQLALMGDKMGYNCTHTNGSLAFDNALLDAKMVLESSDQPLELLVGAVEEISDYNYNIDKLNNLFKTEVPSNKELVNSSTIGTLCGEGATMFVVSNQSDGAIARVADQFQICFPEKEELHDLLLQFLDRNKMTPEDIDLLLFGNSGDVRFDHWYNDLQKNLFPTQKINTFKQFSGDYRTANAFGCYLAVKLLQGVQSIKDFQFSSNPKTVLVYNQFSAERHGFILLERIS